MPIILPDILTLAQHAKTLNQELKRYYPDHCSYCGHLILWFHGYYQRKSDREHALQESLNPILIPRFFCPHCKKTCSVLPECIPPKRWYLWLLQQQLLLQLLLGGSINAAHHSRAPPITPSRSTIARWWQRLQEQLQQQRDALCAHLHILAKKTGLIHFWQTCFEHFSLSKAMLICHQSGILIP
jgi:hypothetical protein